MLDEYNYILPVDTRNPINRSHPLLRGILALYIPISNLVGGQFFYDLIGTNHLTGVLQSSAAGWKNVEAGIGFGKAVVTDGNASTCYRNIACRGLPSFTDPKGFSFSVWTYIVGNQNPAIIFEMNDNFNTQGTAGISFEVKNATTLGWVNNVNGSPYTAGANPNLFMNIPFHSMFTGEFFDTNGLFNYYINGSLFSSAATGAGTNSVQNHIRLFSNSFNGNSEAIGAGTIVYEVAIWNRILNANEVFAWYNLGRSRYINVLNKVNILSPKFLKYFTCSVGLPNLPFAVRVG